MVISYPCVALLLHPQRLWHPVEAGCVALPLLLIHSAHVTGCSQLQLLWKSPLQGCASPRHALHLALPPPAPAWHRASSFDQGLAPERCTIKDIGALIAASVDHFLLTAAERSRSCNMFFLEAQRIIRAYHSGTVMPESLTCRLCQCLHQVCMADSDHI